MIEMPLVNVEICNGCGLCVSACSCGAVVMVAMKATIIESQDCGWCTVCEAICPVGAISCPYEIVIEG
ncbi:MAG: 4Fe-4S ferredoxin [Dehalococcoidia bacterium]|nr:4Fe-4S ferredoxin [Dehalococcoidia bacterium]